MILFLTLYVRSCKLISFFWYLSITRILSATTRVVLDSVRTLNIWVLSIIFGWQDFQWMHLLGFTIYLLGLLTFHLDDINGECHCCGCRTTEMTAA